MATLSADEAALWRTDALSWVYLTIAVLHSAAVVSGLVFLSRYRHSHAIRIRGFWEIVISVFCLYAYLTMVFLVYCTNGRYPCGAEFWVMSLLLPFGIAFFQAHNSALWSLYEQQRRFAQGDRLLKRRFALKQIVAWWRSVPWIRKVTYGIMSGIVIELVVTFTLYFGSRRFHNSYGFFGKHTNPGDCRRGLEWQVSMPLRDLACVLTLNRFPSIFWQFSWSWIFGPLILYKIRGIEDTYYWARQTRLAVIACLPGTPLWLIFLYGSGKNPGLAAVNKYAIPPIWFVPGLLTIEFVSIYYPIKSAIEMERYINKAKLLRNEMEQSRTSSENSKNLYSISSLEKLLESNPEPLVKFASEKQFTSENVLFLKRVKDFKKKWDAIEKQTHGLDRIQKRDCFEDAAKIYFELVNPNTAAFSINVEASIYKNLGALFANCRYIPFEDRSKSEDRNIVTPWADWDGPANNVDHSDTSAILGGPSPSLAPSSVGRSHGGSDIDKLYQLPVLEIELRDDIVGTETSYSVPAAFTSECFNPAFESVRYLVFTNTWTKFIDSFETQSIVDSVWSDDSDKYCKG